MYLRMSGSNAVTLNVKISANNSHGKKNICRFSCHYAVFSLKRSLLRDDDVMKHRESQSDTARARERGREIDGKNIYKQKYFFLIRARARDNYILIITNASGRIDHWAHTHISLHQAKQNTKQR